MSLYKHYFKLFCLILLLTGCSRKGALDRLFNEQTPYEKYKLSLEKAALTETALGKDWLQAGKNSLNDSLLIDLPYQESGYFSPDKPTALFLRYQVREGQHIYISAEPLAQPEATFFVDVFALSADQTLESIHAADTVSRLSYEVEASGWHAVRIQPELLRGGAYLLRIDYQPTLSFPVAGKNSRAIGSVFGDPREGGKRNHKGIDIFAPKGTPVLAASGGIVGTTMNNHLGGKVVWLNNLKRRFTQYYAHLDSQTVRPGQQVSAGDTLGFVGNTGNARKTPPHLHFGIYKFGRGAVDPYPFVHQVLEEAPADTVDGSELGIPARIKASLANIRRAPTTASEVIASFPLHTLVNIEGKSGRWFRITLPDTQQGFIHDSLIESADQPIREVTLTDADYFYANPTEEAIPLSGALATGSSQVLAVYDSLLYVQTPQGYHAWVPER